VIQSEKPRKQKGKQKPNEKPRKQKGKPKP
jgi:hypothetical protein